MGLSGVKKRTKLSQDPNNTAWANCTTNFGHKILSKQGWKPGEYLGAENATHSDHYTAANASHIRVLLREDNLGLGAKIGGGNAETFGLSMFSGLLGRLNGKSEAELQRKQDAIRDVELRTYTGRKFGYMNFVSGGLLVGDKIEQGKRLKDLNCGIAPEEPEVRKKRKASAMEATNVCRKQKSGGNKASSTEASPKSALGTVPNSSDKSQDDVNDTSPERAESSPDRDYEAAAKREKKLKKDRRKAEKRSMKGLSRNDSDEKTRAKEEKRAHKEERRRRKEERRAKTKTKETRERQELMEKSTEIIAVDAIATAAPVVSTGRQMIRQRYIQQKRMASMDPQALKEIFMLQAKAAA